VFYGIACLVLKAPICSIQVQSHENVWHQRLHTQAYIRGTLGIRRARSNYANISRCTLLYAEAKLCVGHVNEIQRMRALNIWWGFSPIFVSYRHAEDSGSSPTTPMLFNTYETSLLNEMEDTGERKLRNGPIRLLQASLHQDV